MTLLTTVLLTLAQDPSIEELVARLGSPDWRAREEATARLIDIGAPVIPHLRPLLNASDPEIRGRAEYVLNSFRYDNRDFVLSLLDLGDDGLQMILDRWPQTSDPDEQRVIIDVLGLTGDERALPILLAAARMAQPDAIARLGRFDHPEISTILQTALAGGVPDQQIAAVRAMGDSGSEVWIRSLYNALPIGGAVRSASVDSLILLATQENSGEIAFGLENRDPWVRRLACALLGRTGDESAAARLSEVAAGDRDSDVRDAAARALTRLQGE